MIVKIEATNKLEFVFSFFFFFMSFDFFIFFLSLCCFLA